MRFKVGRPPVFKTPEEMQEAIEEYFTSCSDGTIWVRPITITGLANAIGLSRTSLLSYEVKPLFVDTVKKAKNIVEQYVEETLFNGKSAAGTIFSLKNNFKDWKDRSEIETHNHNYSQYLDSIDPIDEE